LTTIGASGTVRLPESDFGEPIEPQRSARCRTVSSPVAKSTSSHRKPRSSLARRPVKIAVTISGRALLTGLVRCGLARAGLFVLPFRQKLWPLRAGATASKYLSG
jgi:hypothetical protein